MASQPTFDLTVPGRPDSSVMDWFARRGFVCWCVDMEGYGRSDKTRDIYCDIANGADDLAAATDYIAQTRGVRPVPDLRHFVGRVARGVVRAAPSRARRAARARRVRLDRRRRADARAAAQEAAGIPRRTSAGRSIARSCIRSSQRDHPDCAEQRVVDAFADAILALDDSMPNGTYIDMCSKLPVVDPALITMPTLVLRGQYDGIAAFDDLIEFFKRLPQSRQAVHGDGRHLARELPAEELPDGLSHPARLLHAARARLRRVTCPLSTLKHLMLPVAMDVADKQ